MDSKVARRYAQALFNSADKLNVVRSVEDDLAGVAGLLRHDAQFRKFLLSPETSRDDKLKIADKLFSDRVTALSMQMLRLVLQKRREGELEQIYDEFVTLRRDQEGVVFATIVSAEEMTSAQKNSLEAKIALMTSKKIEAKYSIDSKLIGGVRAKFGNTVLDGSVAGSLQRMRDHLTHDLLKQA